MLCYVILCYVMGNTSDSAFQTQRSLSEPPPEGHELSPNFMATFLVVTLLQLYLRGPLCRVYILNTSVTIITFNRSQLNLCRLLFVLRIE